MKSNKKREKFKLQKFMVKNITMDTIEIHTIFTT